MTSTVYLRDAGGLAFDGEWDECWVPCAKGDPGAVEFSPSSEAPPVSQDGQGPGGVE